MDLVWHWLTYAFLIALMVGAAMVIPRCERVRPGDDYRDIDNLDPTESIAIDTTVRVHNYDRGDAVCYQLGEDEPLDRLFGWVAARPGDEVSIVAGTLIVNGETASHTANLALPAAGPIRVPVDHLYIVSDGHRYDSIAHGPIPGRALRGRVAELP